MVTELDNFMQEGGDNWGGATAIVAPAGAAAEAIRYSKTSSLYLWMLGYEFTGKNLPYLVCVSYYINSVHSFEVSLHISVMLTFPCRHHSHVHEEYCACNCGHKED